MRKKIIINPVKARLEQTSNFKNRKIAIRKKSLKKAKQKITPLKKSQHSFESKVGRVEKRKVGVCAHSSNV